MDTSHYIEASIQFGLNKELLYLRNYSEGNFLYIETPVLLSIEEFIQTPKTLNYISINKFKQN